MKNLLKVSSGLLLLSLLDCSAGCDMGVPIEIDPCASNIGTTSHDFIWLTDTLGDGNSSVLNDVFIVNDTCVWAVGEIYLKDSTGQIDPQAYNAARWNGVKWNLSRIVVRDFGSVTGYFPLKAVFGFSLNDVWFASDADLIQWNGSSFAAKAFFMTSIPFDGQVQQMWGSSNTSIYCVGRTGAVYYYNGSTWFKVVSGTTTDIQDIWGVTDENSSFVLCAVSEVLSSGEMRILRIASPSNIQEYPWGTGRRIHSLWYGCETRLFASGGGIFTRANNQQWNEVSDVPLIFTRSVRGNHENDVFVVGDFGFVAHYNGASWKYYTGKELPSFTGVWSSVAVSPRQVIAVGFVGDKALVLRGNRQ